jgi:membrane protein
MIWLILFAVYALVPNTNVALRPAAVGAVVGALLLEFGKRFLGAYLQNAFAISHLYGSLGLVPLFMFWVYLMWLCVLFGLQVSATLQLLGNRTLDELDHPGAPAGKLIAAVEPAEVVSAVSLVAGRFADGQATSPREMAERCGMTEPAASRLLEQLAESGIVSRIDGARTAYSLARPAETVPLGNLLEIAFQLVDSVQTTAHTEVVERLRDAQRSALQGITLADPIARFPAESAARQPRSPAVQTSKH